MTPRHVLDGRKNGQLTAPNARATAPPVNRVGQEPARVRGRRLVLSIEIDGCHGDLAPLGTIFWQGDG
jgi:hypothetical protein